MAAQLTLDIGLRDGATFALFEPGANLPLVAALEAAEEPFLFLWGPVGCGRTHLLQAACHHHASQGGSPVYLPLPALVAQGAVAMLEGLEQLGLICLDDLEAVAGEPIWERALFNLYNRARAAGTRLIAAAASPPQTLPIALPDLRSRLAWGPVFQLQELDDAGKIAALRRRAAGRGLELPEEVGQWLLRRCERDLPSLLLQLDRLDHASLAAQRRLTIPFVRSVLGAATTPPDRA